MAGDGELYSLADFAISCIDYHERPIPKTELKEKGYHVTREAYQFACWLHGVDDPESRKHGMRWAHLAAVSATEGLTFVDPKEFAEDSWVVQDQKRRAKEMRARKEAKKKRKAEQAKANG